MFYKDIPLNHMSLKSIIHIIDTVFALSKESIKSLNNWEYVD